MCLLPGLATCRQAQHGPIKWPPTRWSAPQKGSPAHKCMFRRCSKKREALKSPVFYAFLAYRSRLFFSYLEIMNEKLRPDRRRLLSKLGR